MLTPFLRLIIFVLVGYGIFYTGSLRRKILPAVTFVVVNILIPLYMITRYGSGWDQAVGSGAFWMPIFFAAGGLTIFLQYLLARLMLRRTVIFDALDPLNQKDFLLLFAVHNAGYIPLPILEVLAPRAVIVYMFFYVLAFQLIFWSFAVSIIQSGVEGGVRIRLKINMPLIGICLGVILAATGIYQSIPAKITLPLERWARFAMDGILIVLGGILAGVPHERLGAHREFGPFILWRQVAFPAAVLLMFISIRLIAGGPALLPPGPIRIEDTWRWLQLVLVIQAAVPPATNLMIAIKKFGSGEQLMFTGSGIIICYLGAVVSLPIFVLLAYFL